MEKLKILKAQQSVEFFAKLLQKEKTQQVAAVQNLDFIKDPVAFYPLANKTPLPLTEIAAIAMDMDGTSTTTEPLALQALEQMVRCITKQEDKACWAGLDPVLDHPHIIGNSNLYHVEFLLRRYQAYIKQEALEQGFIEALLWTVKYSKDKQRKRETLQTAVNCGLGGLAEETLYKDFLIQENNKQEPIHTARRLYQIYKPVFAATDFLKQAAMALDIYYYKYHSMLALIGNGQGGTLAKELLGSETAVLIGPMPGFALYSMLIRGWLGDEAEKAYPLFAALLEDTPCGHVPVITKRQFIAQAERFAAHPVKTALATASIFYEADTVMNEVCRVIKRQIPCYPFSSARKRLLSKLFSSYRNIFDAVITATDASEARLKPHSDIYSMALYRMAIPKTRYRCCIAFEDTQPGIISARAAGYGVTIAMPNRDTQLQDYSCAGTVVHGGLAQVVLQYNHFLKIPGEE